MSAWSGVGMGTRYTLYEWKQKRKAGLNKAIGVN
jgi:hypothetical protein